MIATADPPTRGTSHILVALMQDHPGVLNRVSSLFRRRMFNIESLTVGHSDRPGLSRMTIVVDGATTSVAQVISQLNKLVEVINVTEVPHNEVIAHDLALIKVAPRDEQRDAVHHIAHEHNATVVHENKSSLLIQGVGPEKTLDHLIEALQQYDIQEMVRTGTVAMVK